MDVDASCSHGEPGIGKTRLLEELAPMAHERGACVLWGRCYEGEAAPSSKAEARGALSALTAFKARSSDACERWECCTTRWPRRPRGAAGSYCWRENQGSRPGNCRRSRRRRFPVFALGGRVHPQLTERQAPHGQHSAAQPSAFRAAMQALLSAGFWQKPPAAMAHAVLQAIARQQA